MKNILLGALTVYIGVSTYAVYRNYVQIDENGETKVEKKLKELTIQ